MEISQILIAAKAAFLTAEAQRAALSQAAGALRAKVTDAGARLPEIAAEIDRLRGLILEDDAVAGVSGAARLSAKERGEAGRRIAALCAERAEMAESAEGGEAGARALQDRVAGAISAVRLAAEAFVKEKRRFDAALGIEFQGDFGRLTMPDLFRKWSVIPHGGIAFRLDNLSMAAFGGEAWDGCTEANSPILYHGRYLDPDGGWVDWKASWHTDQALAALRDEYIDLAALETRCAGIVARAEQQRKAEAEAAWQAEHRRRQGEYKPAAVNSYTAPTSQTAQEREGHAMPPTPPDSFTVRERTPASAGAIK